MNQKLSEPTKKMNSMKLKIIIFCIGVVGCQVFTGCGKGTSFSRSDFSFILGGAVPGVRILKPDFPENREDYPFLWSENEYVIDLAASYRNTLPARKILLKNNLVSLPEGITCYICS